MKVSREELERRLGHFEDACRKVGVKRTHQRMEIFRELAASETHPDAETIYKAVRKRVHGISLDTVYRTLWRLRDLGVINTVGLPSDTIRFDAFMGPHHHYVCVECGLIRDFESSELDNLTVPEQVSEFGGVEAMRIEVRGVCRRCAQKKRPQ